MKSSLIARTLVSASLLASAAPYAMADCSQLPDWNTLHTALVSAVQTETSGLDLNMWATIVDRDGIVCQVAFSGSNRGSQWPASRVISAQKANTANSLSLDSSATSAGGGYALALSTANLYSAVQPGGSLYGLQFSNPVDPSAAYAGNSANNGTASDPLRGRKVGGVNVFGGGLALYGPGKVLLGAVGVSGDTSCADHNIGWRVRNNLALDHLLGVGGVSGNAAHPDNIIYDITTNSVSGTGITSSIGGTGVSAGGFGHPTCINTDLNVNALPPVAN